MKAFEKVCLGLVLALGLTGAHAQESQTIKKLKETKTITLASREVSIPINYLDGNQRPVGYGIDICLYVVESLKKNLNLPDLKVAYSPVNSTNRMPLLANGTTDIQCASDGNLEERWKQISFSNTYFMSGMRYLAKKDSNLKTIEDLKGKTVVPSAGTLNLKLLYDFNEKMKLGKIKEMYDRWFMQPIPPRGVNMNLPMGDTLAKTLANPTDSFDLSTYPK